MRINDHVSRLRHLMSDSEDVYAAETSGTATLRHTLMATPSKVSDIYLQPRQPRQPRTSARLVLISDILAF